MGNFKDFDLDLKKIKFNEEGLDGKNATTGFVCGFVTDKIITSVTQGGKDCFTSQCPTNGCPSTMCSPSDMTACRNGEPGVGVRC